MDIQKKYGIRNAQGILLLAQLFLVKLGLVIQLLVLLVLILNHLDVYMLISTITMILAHSGVLVYCYIGYKKSRVFYYVTVGLFLLAIAVNICMPFRDTVQRSLLLLLFGFMTVFMVRQENHKFANAMIITAATIALGFSIYSTITANPSNLGATKLKILATIVMYLSIYSPVVFVGLFGSAYSARYTKEIYLKDHTLEPRRKK